MECQTFHCRVHNDMHNSYETYMSKNIEQHPNLPSDPSSTTLKHNSTLRSILGTKGQHHAAPRSSNMAQTNLRRVLGTEGQHQDATRASNVARRSGRSWERRDNKSRIQIRATLGLWEVRVLHWDRLWMIPETYKELIGF